MVAQVLGHRGLRIVEQIYADVNVGDWNDALL